VRLGAAARPEVGDREMRRPPLGVELVLEVDDVDGERRRVAAANWPVTEELMIRPKGLRDFRCLTRVATTGGSPQAASKNLNPRVAVAGARRLMAQRSTDSVSRATPLPEFGR
jgi:hypothetical protein